MMHDVRLAARGLRRAPGFTAVVLASLTLAVAVAAITTTVYAAYLLRPLPYAEGDRLYHVRYAPPGPWEPAGLSSLDWHALEDVVEAPVTAAAGTFFLEEASGFSAPYRMLHVSRGFVDGLGVRAALGRVLAPADPRDNQPTPAMISQRVWRDRFGSDPAAVGRELRVERDGESRRVEIFRIVGVLPEGFWFGSDSRDLVDLVAPLRTPVRTYRVRLRAGVPVALAERRITEAVRQVAGDLPGDWPGVTLESMRDRYVAGVRPVLQGAAFASALVVAITIANVAVLALLRVARRRKEIAVRVSLGAGQGRIARMLLAEAVMLAGVASAAGLLIADAVLELAASEIARQLGRPAPAGATAFGLSGDVALVTLAVACLALLVLGILPLAVRATGWRRLADALRGDSRTASEQRGARHWRMALVALQIAGSLTLLAGAGLTVRSVLNMIRTDFGVRTDGLVRVSIDLPSQPDADARATAARYERLSRELAVLARAPVPFFQWPQFAETPKQPVETDGGGAGPVEIAVVPVSAGYFETLEIPLLQGRVFTGEDRIGSTPSAIVSRSAAERLWPKGSALGRQVQVADRYISGNRDRAWRTIVGVVDDVRQTYDDEDLADVYVPFEQAPPSRAAWFYMPLGGEGPSWEPEVRRLAAAIDPRASIRVAVPLTEEAARLSASPRFMAQLIAALAVAAVLLATIGVYGVTAFSLEQRARDVAIRWALGASGGAMARALLAETAVVVAAGAAGGLAGAVAIGRVLAVQLHNLHPLDIPTLAAASTVIVCAALATAAVPAARVGRGDHLRNLADG